MTEPVSEPLGLRGERGAILLSIMVSTALIAMDSTILATAVPSIVADLGEFTLFPWLFSIYLLAQAVSTPVYGKVSDTVGRKPIILVGVCLFVLGSLIAALAPTMVVLIVGRAVQGLGAGAIGPTGMTIVGDIYTVQERAKVQGYIASVWAAASVLGPTFGGVFAQFLSWRGIFWINLPLGALAIWQLLRNYHEKLDTHEHTIDYPGATVLTIGLTALILGVLEGGHAWAWLSLPSLICFAGGALLLAVFVWLERRAAEPIVDFALLRRRLILTTTLISGGVGAVISGLTSFVPTYLEVSIGAPPLLAGLAVAATTLGWPIAGGNAGRVYLRRGFRFTVRVGSMIATLAAIALALGSHWPSVPLVAATCFVIGLGLGLTAMPALIAAQSSVDWGTRGSVTGMSMFLRSAGSALGVAVFGAIANNVIARGGGPQDPATMIEATGDVFIGVALMGVLMVAIAWLMPPTPVPAGDGDGPDAGADAADGEADAEAGASDRE